MMIYAIRQFNLQSLKVFGICILTIPTFAAGFLLSNIIIKVFPQDNLLLVILSIGCVAFPLAVINWTFILPNSDKELVYSKLKLVFKHN